MNPRAKISLPAWLAVLLIALAGCAASPPKPAPGPIVSAAPPLDASYDWHVLLTVPFGSVLKDMPLALHEVLLFRDQEKHGVDADEPECYAINGAVPSFMARVPQLYLLCFRHDRLARVEATVRVAQEEAAKVFADACGLWLKNSLTRPSAEATAGACTGNDDATAFTARVESDSDQAEASISIELDAAEAAPEPPPGQQ
jgi:hypothetical protein